MRCWKFLFLLGFLPQIVAATELPRPYYGAVPGALQVDQKKQQAGDVETQAAVKKLLSDADKLLASEPPSVVEKKKVPPSGDMHDYMSLAPYFWPDATKQNGQPYLRRDGQVNPEARDPTSSDEVRLRAMGAAVETLGLAYYFSQEEKYAKQAARYLKVWFLETSTRMSPHLAYAQAVLGVNDGRGTGILEGLHLAQAIDASVLLAGSSAWMPDDQKALETWASTYLDWLMTSKAGKEEAAAKNNHGTWYDVQKVRLALSLGRRDVAQQTIETALKQRLPTQIESDGRQPLELARTTSLSYSCYNFRAWSELAILGEYVKVDVWHYRTADGRGLRQAIDFLKPYLGNQPQPWPYKQIHAAKVEDLCLPLRRASQVWADSAYEKLQQEISIKGGKNSQLLAPSGLTIEPNR